MDLVGKPSRMTAFDALYAIAAGDGRGEALFGDGFGIARDVYERTLIGNGYPTAYIEFPLLGSPGFDLLTVHSAVRPGSRFAPGAGFGYQATIDWFSGICDKGVNASCGIELDTSVGETERAGVYLQYRKHTDLIAPFLASIGEEARAESYLAVADPTVPEYAEPCRNGGWQTRITSFQITGGEPMAHRRFLDILREIYRRDMDVFAINTNGRYLTQEALDEMKAIGCAPTMKISFDGIGFHDWIRQREGAQQSAFASMELCIDNGLEVVSNTQVNRRNVHVMMPTARLLNGIGVRGMRVIRTTEAPRWEKNVANSCLDQEEYYRSMLDFAVEYSRNGMTMEVETWQYLGLLPRQRSYYLKPVKFASSDRPGERYCCNCTHAMVAVTSDGEVMPCNQMSGYFLKNGISLGNVRRTPLRDLLGGGAYVRAANMTVRDLGNSECGTCRHLGYCGGGCRALGLLHSGGQGLTGLTCRDVTKCRFFEDSWYHRIVEALPGWTNLRHGDAQARVRG